MSGRDKMAKKMKRGRTIVAEREYAESESERMQARKKQHRKQTRAVLVVGLLLVILGLLAYTSGRGIVHDLVPGYDGTGNDEYVTKAKIVDEDNRGQISERTRSYIALLEQDLRDLGYTATQFVLPAGMSRELYVDLSGVETYLKVNIDRGAAVTAEDADRALKYLKEKDLHPEYVDVRVEGKAYYK